MPFDKLYVRIKCLACRGEQYMHNASFHSPLDPYKWKRCPYCEQDGLITIEAGAHAIVEYFEQLTQEKRERLLEKIAQKNNGE